MNCPKCGKDIENGSAHCPECGERLVEEQSKQVEQKTVFCEKCGSKIPADSRFCPECGSVQNKSTVSGIEGQRQQRQSVQNRKVLSAEDEARLKKQKKILGTVFGAGLGLCVIIMVLSILIKPSINLNKYISISFEGYDTVGTAVVTFDTEKFEADYEEKMSKAANSGKSKGLSKYQDEEEAYKSYLETLFGMSSTNNKSASSTFLAFCVDGSLDKDSDLCNGDVVTYKWNCDDDLAMSRYGYKLKYKDIEVTVESLEEAETFDPFEGLQITFDGINQDGYASIESGSTAETVYGLNFDIDKSSGLSNGDTITVTANRYYDDPVDYCIQNYGMVPSPLSKTYTVDGLDSYVTSLSEVSGDSLNDMQNQAEGVFSVNLDEYETLEDFRYIGDYLLVNKERDDYWRDQNILCLVYKATVKIEYSNDVQSYNGTKDIYWYICYYDLLVNTEGTVIADLENYGTPGEVVRLELTFDDVGFKYYGYETLNELYQDVVVSNSESYECEENLDENLVSDESKWEDGIVFSDSSEREISLDEIEKSSDEDIKYAINELYARHGYIFKDEELLAYYEKYDWYEPSINPDDFSMDFFNDVEKVNVEKLQKERDSRN